MSDLRQQLHDYYAGKSLPPEKVTAILSGRGVDALDKVVVVPSFWRRYAPALQAIAAMLVIFAGVAMWQVQRKPKMSYAMVVPGIVEFFHTPPTLPMRSQKPEELRAWLVAQGAPSDFQIPEKLRSLKSLGCQVVDMHGRPTYLACFWREQGELVHVFVARRRDFRDLPPESPQMREMAGWSFASWTQGDAIYTMTTKAPMEKLRPFVAQPVENNLGRAVVANL